MHVDRDRAVETPQRLFKRLQANDTPGARNVRYEIDLDLLGHQRKPACVQLFSRYPVLNIHATTARQVAKNPSVIARLTPTPTSEVS